MAGHIDTLNIPVSDLGLKLNVTLPKALTFRMRIAAKLILLAGIVLGKSIEVELIRK